MKVTFWGREHRKWQSDTGPRDFYSVTVLTEDGGAGQLRVNEELFNATGSLQRGESVALRFGLQAFRGNMEPRVVGIERVASK